MKERQKRKFQQLQKELAQRNRPAIPLDKVQFFEEALKFKPYARAKEALNIISVLQEMGFNLELLGSINYTLGKLQSLDEESVMKVRRAFMKSKHTRFMKSFSYHLPYGTKDVYEREIANASLGKLAGLIKICGFLLQTKAYLFWQRHYAANG